MELLEAMRIRRSVRTFLKKEVPKDLLANVAESFEKSVRLNDLKLRLPILPGPEVEHAMTGIVGSYGAMKDPPHYAIGISQSGQNDQENFGLAMEQFVLACTRQGLGTCWVGGFFKKSRLEKAVPMESDERIICVSPVGFAKDRRLFERSMRAVGGLNRRKPLAERVFHQKWGSPATDFLATRPKLTEVFELARWAPSASNKQPCHYVIDESQIVLSVLTNLQSKYAALLIKDRAEQLDFLGVDAGIAMAHIHLAAKELEISGQWSMQFNESELQKRLHIPDTARIVGVFDLDKREQ